MSKLPVVSFAVMDRLLKRSGFEAVRQKGSHVFYRHEDGRTTTVPRHKGHDLARPLIRSILQDIEMSVDTFNTELND